MKTEHTEYTMKNLAAEHDRLKAANAEMLEALQSALAHWEENGDHFVPPIWVDLVRIIIAKAEGGESS